MAKKVAIIVESPTKTRTLARFLGDEYKLLSSKGHVRDLPKDDLAVDIDNDFQPHYQIIPRQRKILSKIRKELEGIEEVYLASDPDREGEAIAWHLMQALDLPDARRIEFNEITEEAVRAALQNPGEINLNRVNAQQARRVLDRLVGYKLSPLLWKKISSKGQEVALSAGRVQSVALRLICDREREIAAFEPEEYWTVEAQLTPDKDSPPFTAELKTKDGEEVVLANEEQTLAVVEDLQRQQFIAAEVEHTTRRRWPQPPFITSTLQRQAAADLYFSASKTMRLAQQLYEGVETDEDTVGLITYMRTDSTRIAKPAQNQARKYIREHFGEEFIGKGARGKKAKGAQEAHECIRPTSVFRHPDQMKQSLNKDQAALYELIWRRFVASQMAPAVYDQYIVDVSAGPYGLRATTSTIKFLGFLRVLPDRKEKQEAQLPALQVNQELQLVDLDPEQHFTQPPPRYNEGSLVRALEENGIGRPSTYAPIIETLRQRRYVRMQKRAFLPTPLGFTVSDYLVEHFPRIMDIEFTAHVEADLDTIERGEREWVEVLGEFYPDFEASLQQAAEASSKPLEGEKCPECGGQLYEKYSAYGKFAGCENYPDCTYKQDLLQDILGKKQPPEPIDEKCPECGQELVKRTNRRGQPFIGCSGYPDCDYTRDLVADDRQKPSPEQLDEKCPECGQKLVKRTSRHGQPFIGCSGYPECRYTRPLSGSPRKRQRTKAIPTDIDCSDCGQKLMLRHGRRGPFLGCSGYPKCKFTRSVNKAELRDLQVASEPMTEKGGA